MSDRPSRGCNSLHVRAGANVRSRLLWLPYGDQALALRAATYRAVGGFRAYSMMVSGTPSRALAITPTHTHSPKPPLLLSLTVNLPFPLTYPGPITPPSL